MQSRKDESASTSTVPISDIILIFLSSIRCEVTLILLFIAQRMALVPYTTKCSPNKMTLPGAEALDFMRMQSKHILPQNSYRLPHLRLWHILIKFPLKLQVPC